MTMVVGPGFVVAENGPYDVIRELIRERIR